MGRIARSFAMLKVSWNVVSNDRSLLIFPVISALCVVAAAAVIFGTSIGLVGLDAIEAAASESEPSPAMVVAGLLFAYVSTALAVYFNVALVSCANRSLDGEDTTVSDGIDAANQRLPQILSWALLALTVGLILRALEERLPFAGRIAVMLVGAAWSIATYFVVPVIAFEGTGPIDSAKRSVSVIRKQWGEAIAGNVGIGLATFILLVVPVVILGGMAVAVADTSIALTVTLIVAIIVLIAAVTVVSSALTQVYNTAMYRYATGGDVPAGFSRSDFDDGFRTRKRR